MSASTSFRERVRASKLALREEAKSLRAGRPLIGSSGGGSVCVSSEWLDVEEASRLRAVMADPTPSLLGFVSFDSRSAKCLQSECDLYADALETMGRLLCSGSTEREFTYVAVDGHGAFKFGVSENPLRRLAGCTTWISSEAYLQRLVGFCNSEDISEADAHSECARFRIRDSAEWFRACEETFRMASRICQCGSDDASNILDEVLCRITHGPAGLSDYDHFLLGTYQLGLGLKLQADNHEVVSESVAHCLTDYSESVVA